MGLDSYFKQPDGDEFRKMSIEFNHPPPNLVGGMFSAHGGDGSFRGKCYDGLIKALCGISLYQKEIENDQVLKITESLRLALYEEDSKEYSIFQDWLDGPTNYWRFTADHVKDLHRVFEAFSVEGCHLFGWW